MSAALDLHHGGYSAAGALDVRAPGLLRFITCGSVDDGKSTLIGRILHDAGAVPQDQLDNLEADSRRFGTQGSAPDFALLVDGLAAEREQGITIDVAYRYFATPRRAFIVADTPGHEQYTRNMATGATGADLAVILVDARKGLLPQTLRHAFIVSLVGVRRVVVAVNKMDLVGYDEAVFREIERAFHADTATLGFIDAVVLPVSALTGDNVLAGSPHTPWYEGPTLLRHLETVDTESAPVAQVAPFRLPVQWVNRPDPTFRGFCGSVASGTVRTGDAITVLPSGTASTVKSILGPAGPQQSAGAGEAVTLCLADEVDASRGDMLVAAGDRLVPSSRFRGRLLWMSTNPPDPANILLRVHNVTAPAILTVNDRIDIETYERHAAETLPLNGIGHVTITSERPLVVDPYWRDRDLGAFILMDRVSDETVALGVIDAVEAGPAGRERATGQDVPLRARVLRLLAPEPPASADRLAEAVVWRLVISALFGVIVMVLTGSLAIGLAAGLADAVARTLLRAALRDLLAQIQLRRGDVHIDGSGI